MLVMYKNYKVVTMGALILVNLCLLFLVSSCSVVRIDRPNEKNQEAADIDLYSRRTSPDEIELRNEDSKRDPSTIERVDATSSVAAEEFCAKYPLQCSLVDQVNLEKCASLELATNPERVICVPFTRSPLQSSGANFLSYLSRLLSSADNERVTPAQQQRPNSNLARHRQVAIGGGGIQIRPSESAANIKQSLYYLPPMFGNDDQTLREAAAATATTTTAITNKAGRYRDSGSGAEDDSTLVSRANVSSPLAGQLNELGGYWLDLRDRSPALAHANEMRLMRDGELLSRPEQPNGLIDSREARMSLLRNLIDKDQARSGEEEEKEVATTTTATPSPKVWLKQANKRNTYLMSFEEAKRFMQAQQQQQRIGDRLISANQLASVPALPSLLSIDPPKVSISISKAKTIEPRGKFPVNGMGPKGGAGGSSRRRSVRLHRSQAVVLPKRTLVGALLAPSSELTPPDSSPVNSNSNSNSASAISSNDDDDDDDNDGDGENEDRADSGDLDYQKSLVASSSDSPTKKTPANLKETATIGRSQSQSQSQSQRKDELAPASGADESADAMQCKMRQYTYIATKRDESGNQCSGTVTANICYGGCDTGEIADWLFPYKKSIHKVCGHGGRKKRLILLTECNTDSIAMDDDLRKYHYVDALDCVCKRCTSVDTTCLGTMSSAPHLPTLSS